MYTKCVSLGSSALQPVCHPNQACHPRAKRGTLVLAGSGTSASAKQTPRSLAALDCITALAVRLMTHPGVGSVTALAMVLTLGPAERFASAKQVGSYFGLIPTRNPAAENSGWERLSKTGQFGSVLFAWRTAAADLPGRAMCSAGYQQKFCAS